MTCAFSAEDEVLMMGPARVMRISSEFLLVSMLYFSGVDAHLVHGYAFANVFRLRRQFVNLDFY